jgi:glycerol-3-phosphate dehydrogenase (NAD(P)+)
MKICILGSGHLGVSLAINFSKSILIEKITIYSNNEESIHRVNKTKSFIFDKIKLSDKIEATNNLKNSILSSDLIFICVNSENFVPFLEEIQKLNINLEQKELIICTKGIYRSGFFSEIAKKILNTNNIGLLFGPSFANEIANGDKTFINLIHHKEQIAHDIIKNLGTNHTNLKIYHNSDYIGAQICSVMKNICAIYLGIAKGYELKTNHIAALFKLFLDEIRETIKFYGGLEQTVYDFCGIGDLFLTCTSFESRNYTFGYQIGSKSTPPAQNVYPEGYIGLKNLYEFNNKNGLKLKICNSLYDFLFLNKVTINSIFE